MIITQPLETAKVDQHYRNEYDAEFYRMVSKNSNDNTQIQGIFLVMYIALQAIQWGVFFFIALWFLIWNNWIRLTLINGALYVSLIFRDKGLELRTAIDTGDTATLSEWVDDISPYYSAENVSMTLLQVGITLFNLFIGPALIVVTLGAQYMRTLLILVFTVFGDMFIEVGLMALEFLQLFLRGFGQIAESMSGLGAGAPTGPQTGLFEPFSTGIDGEFGASASTYSSPARFLVRAVQILVRGFATFIAKTGWKFLVFIELIVSVVLKFLPVFLDILSVIIDILSPEKPLGALIFSFTYALYYLHTLLYETCSFGRNLAGAVCSSFTSLNKVVNKVCGKLNVNCDFPVPCSSNIVNKISCNKKPVKPSFDDFGAGLCDSEQCTADVYNIFDIMAVQRPACADWVANANSTIACMNTVYDYSTMNSTSLAASPIDTISKELCFVLATVIIKQCQNSLPPFAFSYSAVATDICVTDKSGLSPPAAAFNDQCACVYAAPLCVSECCNQYALHTIGQIKSHIGSYQCGTILTQFPEEFWCQYAAMNGTDVPPHSDLTFSSDWCAAYLQVIQPACQFSPPILTLNAIDLTSLVDLYAKDFCNSTVNQTGVCIRIDTSTDPDYIQFQYEQTFVGVLDLYGENNLRNPLGFNGQPIETTPYLLDTTKEIIDKDIQKHYCYYFSLLFNSSNPVFLTRHRSVLRVATLYCDQQLAKFYASFAFVQKIEPKMRTFTGQLAPVTLVGIPSNVVVFGSAAGPSSEPDCAYQTGANVMEVADQGVCMETTRNSLTTQMETVNSASSDSYTTLSATSQTFVPASHVSTSTQLDPSDPEYAQKKYERDTLQSAKAQSTDWYTVPASEQEDSTKTFTRIYTSGHDIRDTEFTQRHLSSIDNRDERITEMFGAFKKLNMYDKHSTRVDPIISNRNARRGHKIAHHVLDTMKKDVAEIRSKRMNSGTPGNFAGMRKLTATYAPATWNATISAMWDKIADSQYAEPDDSTQEAKEAANYLFKHTLSGHIPALLNFFYNLNYSASDLGFGAGVNDDPNVDYSTNYGTGGNFGTGNADWFGGAPADPEANDPNCRNTWSHPLKCCTATSTSRQCCRGLEPLCLPPVPDWMFATVTDEDNVDEQWYCDKFVNVFDYFYNGVRVLVTVTFRTFGYSKNDDNLYVTLLGWLAYDNNRLPPNWGGCMIMYSTPLWISIDLLILLYILVSTQTVNTMILYANSQSAVISLNNKIDALEQRMRMGKNSKMQ